MIDYEVLQEKISIKGGDDDVEKAVVSAEYQGQELTFEMPLYVHRKARSHLQAKYLKMLGGILLIIIATLITLLFWIF